MGTMHPHEDIPSLWRSLSLLLLLGLGLPLAVSQTLSYREAVLRAVDDFNQQSLDTNLYRLLDLDSEPQGVRQRKSQVLIQGTPSFSVIIFFPRRLHKSVSPSRLLASSLEIPAVVQDAWDFHSIGPRDWFPYPMRDSTQLRGP